ncbi:MAG: YicC family protein [Chlamydiae bacterium CG10_big_fil_rev_8_21_14_0_10_42_34]|nr:MAG: YicC family protein [Chlamydiae bacterium CG10_big_fil_rev_8_21_14_0_10_42_34]
MLCSMTGFGRAVCDAPLGKLTVEIQSVNRKYLEVSVSSPKEFSRFELDVRKWVGTFVQRGQVFVRISLIPNEAALQTQLPDPKVIKELKKGWEKIAKSIGTDPKEISLSFIMQYLGLSSKPDSVGEKDKASLEKCVVEALKGLSKMKQMEGKALAADLSTRLKLLEQRIGEIEKLAPDATQKMRTKLLDKMAELLNKDVETDERLIKEIALFAERVDISEEIVRFRSHIVQFKELLKGTVVGRKMDFLIQELGRETNTIGSKSMEAKISHLVVDMKSELEKMREQVQNLE